MYFSVIVASWVPQQFHLMDMGCTLCIHPLGTIKSKGTLVQKGQIRIFTHITLCCTLVYVSLSTTGVNRHLYHSLLQTSNLSQWNPGLTLSGYAWGKQRPTCTFTHLAEGWWQCSKPTRSKFYQWNCWFLAFRTHLLIVAVSISVQWHQKNLCCSYRQYMPKAFKIQYKHVNPATCWRHTLNLEMCLLELSYQIFYCKVMSQRMLWTYLFPSPSQNVTFNSLLVSD